MHHGVKILDDALVEAAVVSDRYIADRFLPDKARRLRLFSQTALSYLPLDVWHTCGGWCASFNESATVVLLACAIEFDAARQAKRQQLSSLSLPVTSFEILRWPQSTLIGKRNVLHAGWG